MIKTLEIYPSVKQGTVLQWQLELQAKTIPYALFEIHVSLDGVDWEKIAEVQNTYYYVDHETRVTGTQQRVFYKLVLNGDYEWVSPYDFGSLSLGDRAIIREMSRKELLAQRLGGRQGYLLKRMTCGIACPKCLSDSGESMNPQCNVCYGTGWKHGYHEPSKYGITEQNPKIRVTSRTSGLGSFKPDQTTTRGIAFPHLHNLDVWVDSSTDKRYYITEVEAITFRGLPIIYSDIKLVLAPAEAIVYEVKI